MNTSASKEGLQGIIPKVALSPEQFEALSKSMESDEPIKALMTKTLNLMIEAEFEVKIGAKRVNKHQKENGHQTAPNCTVAVIEPGDLTRLAEL